MKSKIVLVAALLSLNLCAGHTAPRATTKPKSKSKTVVKPKTAVKPKPGTKSKPAVKPLAAAPTQFSGAFINPSTRNNTASETRLTLADDVGPKLPIIISVTASETTKALAKELAEKLEKITGTMFIVKEGDGTRGIVVGTLQEFELTVFAKTLDIKDLFNGREAYAIRTRPHKLMLIGATELGTQHAVYRFLHEIGYRWFFPNKAWEVVPKTDRLVFNRDITDRPAIWSRSIWFEAGSGTHEANDLYQKWRRVNGQSESFVSNTGHNVQNIIPAFAKEFEAHPEYYAVDETGKIIPENIEWTNPAVRALLVEYARNFFKANPNADMVSIEPANSWQYSSRPEARKISYSDQVFGAANEVAIMLQKEFPGKMVGVLAYSNHWDPPTFELEPNVHVQMSALGSGQYSPAERDEIWRTRSKNQGIYEYYSVYLWMYDKLTGSMTNDVQNIQKRIQKQAADGVTAISGEATSNWGLNGRGYYVATQMMWNPDQNIDALLDDFYTKSFGAGAPAMKRYFNTLDPANAKFLSKHLIGTAFRDIDEASKLTIGQPDIQARLDFLKQYLRFAHLDWAKTRDNLTELDGVKIDDEIARHYYRIRGETITTWEMARQTLWSAKDWSGEEFQKPYTHDEIEKNFQEGLQYFPVRTDLSTPVSYSSDLVPVAWTAQVRGNFAAPEKIRQSYQGAMKYALYSVKGEPLEFTTEAGDAWGGINRYSLTDAKGTEISKGTLPNKQTTVHKIAVPRAGLYWLDYNDSSSHWTMESLPDRASTIPLGTTASQTYNTSATPQMFFYVPKGIKSIEYYYSRISFQQSGAHKILDPSGKAVKDVDVNGDWISVPVPAGMDGKIWSFQNPVLGFFWFNNLPNYYAATPNGLLIPREIAKKDGLALRK